VQSWTCRTCGPDAMLPGQRVAGRSKNPSGRTVFLETPKEETASFLTPPQTPDGETLSADRPPMSPASSPTASASPTYPTFRREVSMREDAFERRPRSAPRRKVGLRAKNPFIEYDVREKRLNQERKWLQEDTRFMEQRREELRLGALMNQLNISNDTEDLLYENRTFYGPHSMAMKATKAKQRTHRPRLRANSAHLPERRPPKEAAFGKPSPKEPGFAAVTLKSLSQVLKSSSDDVQQRYKDMLRKEGFAFDDPDTGRYRFLALARGDADVFDKNKPLSRSCSKN